MLSYFFSRKMCWYPILWNTNEEQFNLNGFLYIYILESMNFLFHFWLAAGLLLRQRVFFFSPEFCSQLYQNYGTYRRVFLFHQNFVPDITKIMGHTGGSFFFTRILSPTILKFRDILMKKKLLLKIYKQSSYVLTIRPRLAFCHRQPRG